MASIWRFFLLSLLCSTGLSASASWAAGEPRVVRVAVLEDAPPMGYRDTNGKLTGFSLALMQALCDEVALTCQFHAESFEHLVDDLAAGYFDVAAVGLLNTPERRQRLLFTRPVYRSQTLFFARPGVRPGQAGVRLSIFKGSAQERYIKSQGWDYAGAQTDADIVDQLEAGVTQACVVPLMTSLNLQKNRAFLKLGLVPMLLRLGDLDNDASFGIAPQRSELKAGLDSALERIKLNGVYDRINSKFLPFRVE